MSESFPDDDLAKPLSEEEVERPASSRTRPRAPSASNPPKEEPTLCLEAPLGRAVTIHGGRYDVGEQGHQWHMEYPDGQEEAERVGRPHTFTTVDVVFVPHMPGTYVLRLPVKEGRVCVEIVVVEEAVV